MNTITADLKIQGKTVTFKVDSGCGVNILPKHIYKSLDKDKKVKLKPVSVNLVAYGGQHLPVLGKCHIFAKLGSIQLKSDFYVVDLNTQPHLSLDTSLSFKLIKLNKTVNVHNIQQKMQPSESTLLIEFEDVFSGRGCVEGEYEIHMNPDAQAVIQPPRKIPLSIQPQLRKT